MKGNRKYQLTSREARQTYLLTYSHNPSDKKETEQEFGGLKPAKKHNSFAQRLLHVAPTFPTLVQR